MKKLLWAMMLLVTTTANAQKFSTLQNEDELYSNAIPKLFEELEQIEKQLHSKRLQLMKTHQTTKQGSSLEKIEYLERIEKQFQEHRFALSTLQNVVAIALSANASTTSASTLSFRFNTICSEMPGELIWITSQKTNQPNNLFQLLKDTSVKTASEILDIKDARLVIIGIEKTISIAKIYNSMCTRAKSPINWN